MILMDFKDGCLMILNIFLNRRLVMIVVFVFD